MAEDVANNLRVEEDDGEHGEEVGKDPDEEDEHLVLNRVGEVVEGAAGEVAFGRETAPNLEQGHQGPGQCVRPGQHHHDGRLSPAHSSAHGVRNIPEKKNQFSVKSKKK